jgi:hypothetical protein
MALQDSGSIPPIVSMSAKDINNELGEGLSAVFDFGGAAASFSGITDDTTIEMLEFYNKTFGGGTETYGSRPTLVANYYGNVNQGGEGESTQYLISTWDASGELIDCAENNLIGADDEALYKTVYHTMNNNATFDVGDYLYNEDYSPGTPSASIDWTDPDNDGQPWTDGQFADGYMVDTTNDVIFKLDISNGEVLALRSRTPSIPGIPENAGGATSTSVGIQFTSNTEVSDTFKVYKSTTSGGTYSEHTNKSITAFSKGSDTDTSTTITITVNGLASSTDYFFKVAGVNDFATGTQSDFNLFAISTSAGGGGGCFAYGTQILMADGTTKNIEEIMVGDVVKSMSIPDMPIVEGTDDDWNTYKDFTTNSLVSSSLSTATVRKAVTDSYDNYYKITLGNGDILKVTFEHPLFVQRDGVYQWTKVNHTELSSSLKTTDLLVDKDKNTQTISSIDFVDEVLDVGTIDVEDLDVYFANNYLVHNAEK